MLDRKLITSLALSLVFLGAAACNQEGTLDTEGEAQAPLAGADKAEQARKGGKDGMRRGHPGHGMRGPESLLVTALRELELSDAQSAVIEDALDALPRPERGERPDAAAMKALADGVRAGSVDVEAVLADAGDPMATQRNALAAALTTLHEALTPAQRRELVDTVIAEMDAHTPPAEMRGPPPGKRAKGGRGGEMKGPFGDLDLSDAQRAALDAALEADKPEPEDMKEHFESMKDRMQEKLETFAASSFDASAFVAPPADAPTPRAHIERFARAMAAVAPLLDADQREELADRLEQGPPAKGRHGRGHR
jgi:hypothetical protein